MREDILVTQIPTFNNLINDYHKSLTHLENLLQKYFTRVPAIK